MILYLLTILTFLIDAEGHGLCRTMCCDFQNCRFSCILDREWDSKTKMLKTFFFQPLYCGFCIPVEKIQKALSNRDICYSQNRSARVTKYSEYADFRSEET
jgi:hypothetical protein